MMNLKYIMILLVLGLTISSCTKDQFDDAYANPEKLATTTIERQYTGVQKAGIDFVIPTYRNYFVNLRITLNPWTQSIGWINSPGQYIPGSSGNSDVWGNYYDILAQYREFEKVFDASTSDRQTNLKIFKQTADIYMYYETARMVDLYGSIPFFDAGRLSQNGGDYANSYAAFDSGDAIYTFLLDELKVIADDFSTSEPTSSALVSLAAQDIINSGDYDLWKRTVNSLRLRLLNRVSLSSMSGRATSEIGEILGNPSKYPIIENNDQNTMIDIFDVTTQIHSKGFDAGINSGGWDGDDAPKAMIDFLNETNDPRIRVLFEPGDSANGEYIGLDPLMLGNNQTQLRATAVIANYNRTTTSLNQYFPGVVVSAAEVSLIKAEYYVKNGDDVAAQEAYETSIKQSTEFYMYVNSLSADRTSGTPDPATDEEYEAVFSSAAAGWGNAGSQDAKIELIAKQKWVHFNIIQPYQNWAEIRRLDAPTLNFWEDNSSVVKLPPMRFNIPDNELTFNASNYEAIKDQDRLENKIFWDVN